MFYLVPNGNNPSGETISAEKRRQIYGLARRYDFIILEDDPYYAIQYDEVTRRGSRGGGAEGTPPLIF